MKLYLAKPGGPLEGPFTLESINADLAARKYKDSDYWAWHESLTDWVPLYSIGGVRAARDTSFFFAKPASVQNPAPTRPPEPPASDTGFFLLATTRPAPNLTPITLSAPEMKATKKADADTPAIQPLQPTAETAIPEPPILTEAHPAPDLEPMALEPEPTVSPAALDDLAKAEKPATAEADAIEAALQAVNAASSLPGSESLPVPEEPQASLPTAEPPPRRASRVRKSQTKPVLASPSAARRSPAPKRRAAIKPASAAVPPSPEAKSPRAKPAGSRQVKKHSARSASHAIK